MKIDREIWNKKEGRTIPYIYFFLALLLVGCAPATATREQPSPQATQPAAPTEPRAQDFTLAQSDAERDQNPEVADEALAELTAGNTDFAFDLYQSLRQERGNLFYSPYSISTALAMVYAGARAETERQMAETLHFRLQQDQLHPAFNALDLRLNARPEGGSEDENFQLVVANSLWGQIDFNYQQAFLDLLARNYGAGLRLVDFVDPERRERARLAINDWVSDRTEGRIQDLIPPDVLNDRTRLVLANAIYFKADWEQPFLNGTEDQPFHLLDGDEVIAPLMSRRAITPYFAGPGFQAAALAYKGGRAEMLVILPDEGQFEVIEQMLSREFLEELEQNLAPTDLKLFLPKFSYESTFSLAETLAAMGMPDAFDRRKADFSGIPDDPDLRLFISHVLHKAFVAVDEMGTEAAAATAVVVEVESLPVELRVDRAFLFIIRDVENDTVLFVGRVLNPAQ